MFRRGTRSLLPPHGAGPGVDLGCGAGLLVRLLQTDGFDAGGINISLEQAALAHAVGAPRVRQGDGAVLAVHPAHHATITAANLREHFASPEVLQTFDDLAAALTLGGVFLGRVPNCVSPVGGHIRDGDSIHQTSFSARSIRQFAAAVGVHSVLTHSSRAIAHRLAGVGRVMAWQVIGGYYRIALAAEKGMLRGHIGAQNLVFAARKDVVTMKPAES